MAGYEEIFRSSVEDREGFWLRAASVLDWHVAPTTALDESDPPFYRWFPDGELNVCHNALDRHVEAGNGDRIALVHDSPVTGTKRSYTYSDLRDEVATFAGVLRDQGVGRGDRVVIYMPMVPEAAVAMLACARLGAIHSVVFGGFAAKELAVRIDDAGPKVVVSASCGIEGSRVIEYKPLLDKAIELSGRKPDATVILQREQAVAAMGPIDVDWAAAAATATPADPVPVRSTDPLYVLYTSGTTGKPKGVVRDSGGYATALAWSMPNIYDVGAGETIFTASDVGWVVGHSYIVYAPLLAGATTVLYEGKPVGTPDAGQFWRVVQENKVKSVFTAPTAFRAIKKEDPEGAFVAQYDVSSLQYLFLAGERLDPETYRWAADLLGIPVIDHWWQTETGWPIAANPAGIELLDIKPGSPTRPMPGWDVQVLDETGRPAEPGVDGAIVAKLPLPPGAFPTLWNDDERYVNSYMAAFEGYYLTGDGGHLDSDGYVFVMGRTDDVINVAGHRLSTGGMEEVLASHPDVAECAVIGVADTMKGQIPRGFVVLKSGVDSTAEGYDEKLRAELVQMVRDQIGAVASLKDVAVVPALPKTRSGKILRKTMRGIADGADEPVPSTIDDASVLDTLRPVLRKE
ncbi:Acetyl-coenzyme A synthetase [Pseudonocardia sp. Ae168_Ps1]|uniref:propionyl-CoA synthetase n=1 Tax=unclassified Pseudonocardia TaxID=2619320 RepID=UPI00094B1D16|nr:MULTISPECIES: propionyl-CoA synthetase [unclassified Pseudonocardia]OLL75424.1 Acetyl-coenzyme A synthetase [Pseudonocardia sp. Ae150A_Ps1]OLL81420.1 Acetyl-coenzyme A synthetase [Pseudonocardia sp. Ae168_Ps1]OLL84466.1 Acetyl-coenzyme A synthetase [Pseudonocardia sp. Ae263_Ps1]OLL95514.1 Acetyl-coenzyme A synthetase [Pseudonocardia sp. Ae356_Ps1]